MYSNNINNDTILEKIKLRDKYASKTISKFNKSIHLLSKINSHIYKKQKGGNPINEKAEEIITLLKDLRKPEFSQLIINSLDTYYRYYIELLTAFEGKTKTLNETIIEHQKFISKNSGTTDVKLLGQLTDSLELIKQLKAEIASITEKFNATTSQFESLKNRMGSSSAVSMPTASSVTTPESLATSDYLATLPVLSQQPTLKPVETVIVQPLRSSAAAPGSFVEASHSAMDNPHKLEGEALIEYRALNILGYKYNSKTKTYMDGNNYHYKYDRSTNNSYVLYIHDDKFLKWDDTISLYVDITNERNTYKRYWDLSFYKYPPTPINPSPQKMRLGDTPQVPPQVPPPASIVVQQGPSPRVLRDIPPSSQVQQLGLPSHPGAGKAQPGTLGSIIRDGKYVKAVANHKGDFIPIL
jgi:hypothetical protein